MNAKSKSKAPVEPAERHTTIRLKGPLAARVDNALAHVPRAVIPSQTFLIVQAIEAAVADLERVYNKGKPFPPAGKPA